MCPSGPKLEGFQREMRGYMPSPQRDLLDEIDAEMHAVGTMRAIVEGCGGSTTGSGGSTTGGGTAASFRLRRAYASSCTALGRLRAYHLGIATHYLRKALKGTGGSDFRALLDEGLASTREAARRGGCTGLG